MHALRFNRSFIHRDNCQSGNLKITKNKSIDGMILLRPRESESHTINNVCA